jgi:hypothetical protein
VEDQIASLKKLIQASSNLQWPTESRTKDLTLFQKQLEQFQEVGWLRDPLFVAWDDWNLETTTWEGTAPFFFSHWICPGIFHATFWSILIAKELQLVSPLDRGVSHFVYRSLPRKTTLLFEKNEKASAVCKQDSGCDSVIKITFPAASDFHCISPMIERINQIFSAKFIDIKLISRTDFYKWCEQNPPTDEEKESLTNTLTTFVDSKSTILDSLNEQFIALIASDDTQRDKLQIPARNSLLAAWIIFSFPFDDLTGVYYVPAHGFLNPEDKKEEESSGGIYVWCSKNTICMTDWIKLHETYRGLRTSVHDWAILRRELALEKAKEAARAAVMSRNFSHNVGSHSIANPRLYDCLDLKGTKQEEARTRLRTFHNYSQGRLDFMARAMSGSGEQPEPLFFVNDVLKGFFRQGVLLDTLVEDSGFPAEKLTFKVAIKERTNVETASDFWWDSKQHSFVTDGSALKDVLVGVPGGSIGCHALYGFLENCLRNAVKYGEKRNCVGKLELTLRLEKCAALSAGSRVNEMGTGDCSEPEAAWILRISDNVSVDTHFDISSGIRGHINVPLIDEKEGGKLVAQGHGIQEMKVCAETLAGGKNGLRFPNDSEDIPGKGVDCCTTCAEYVEYKEYLAAAGATTNFINERQPLRCYTHPTGNTQERFLVYNLLLPCPILLGFVALGQTNGDGSILPEFVKRYPDIRALAGKGGHFGVIVDSEQHCGEPLIRNTLEKIAEVHFALPFRLMVLSDRKDAWDTIIAKVFDRPANQHFQKDQHIPRNRVRVVGIHGDPEKTIAAVLNAASKDAKYTYLGADGWEAIVLRIYDMWLRAYKPLSSGGRENELVPWKLCIGFERLEALGSPWVQMATKWANSDPNAPCVAYYVEYNFKKIYKSATWPTDTLPENLPKESLLVFDNHCKFFPKFTKSWLKDGPRFYQDTGLRTSLSLYQALENPPSSPFGFAFFAYSLAEAALTRVAVLDERVAQATVKSGELLFNLKGAVPPEGELKFQKASIFPMFSFKGNGEKWTAEMFAKDAANEGADAREWLAYGFLSKTILRAAYKRSWDTVANDFKLIYIDIWEQEGLTVNEDECKAKFAHMQENQNNVSPTCANADADVLVIHEGITDSLQHSRRWKDSDVFRLYECVPAIVRTSGRGRDSRHLGQFLPFVEFSEISANIYGSLNKLSLAKSLLGSAGQPSSS